MRKAICGLVLSGLMVMTMAVGASAHPGHGRVIREQCGMSFGQLVSMVRSGRHGQAFFHVRGGRHLVWWGLIDVLCPEVPETPEPPPAPES